MFTNFHIQHRDYPNKKWVICSICQKDDPINAKLQLTGKRPPTTQMKRHIENYHKHLVDDKEQGTSGINDSADVKVGAPYGR